MGEVAGGSEDRAAREGGEVGGRKTWQFQLRTLAEVDVDDAGWVRHATACLAVFDYEGVRLKDDVPMDAVLFAGVNTLGAIFRESPQYDDEEKFVERVIEGLRAIIADMKAETSH